MCVCGGGGGVGGGGGGGGGGSDDMVLYPKMLSGPLCIIYVPNYILKPRVHEIAKILC